MQLIEILLQLREKNYAVHKIWIGKSGEVDVELTDASYIPEQTTEMPKETKAPLLKWGDKLGIPHPGDPLDDE